MFLQIYKNRNLNMQKQMCSHKYAVKIFSVVKTCKFKFSLKNSVQVGVSSSSTVNMFEQNHNKAYEELRKQ